MADYGDERETAAAVMALLWAQTDIRTYPDPNGGPSIVPPGAKPPYRSVHIYSEDTSVGGRMTHKSIRSINRIMIYHVGANPDAARVLCQRTKEALLDVVVDLPGRSVYPIQHERTDPPQTAEPVAETSVTIPTIYRLIHEPGVDGS
jgi:hypothetical protein